MKISAKLILTSTAVFALTFIALFNFPSSTQAKLNGLKMQACEAKQNGVLTRIQHLNNLANNMFESFDKIAGRVEEYYTTTVLPSGKTVANYSTLVADIAAKKANAQTALAAAQTNSSGFSCKSENPKNNLMQFRTDMQTVKKALKEYRTSIKNLIVAVRSVTGATQRNNTTPKPTI